MDSTQIQERGAKYMFATVLIGKLKTGGFDKGKMKLVFEIPMSGDNGDKLPELASLSELEEVELSICRLQQDLFNSTPKLGGSSQRTLPMLPQGTGIFGIFESNPEFPDDGETLLEERYTARENAVLEMERLSSDNRELRYRVDELTPEFIAEEQSQKPFGVFKVDPEAFRELMPERFSTQGEAEIYMDSLSEIEATRIADCEAAEIDCTPHTFIVENLLDQDEPQAADDLTAGEAEESAVAVVDENDDPFDNGPETDSEPERPYSEMSVEERAVVNARAREFEEAKAAGLTDGEICPNCASSNFTVRFLGRPENRCNDCKKLFMPKESAS